MYSKLRKSRGFTLVELMIVVVIIGILAALAIYGVRKYVTNSKSAEARLAVGRMGKDAAAQYEGEKMGGEVMGLGRTRATGRYLCLSAPLAVPTVPQLEGEKYQPDPTDGVDFENPAANDPTRQYTGFPCMAFSMEEPIYFMYDYQAQTASNVPNGTPAANGDYFTASAQAEMGGVRKSIWTNGFIQQDGDGDLILTVSPKACEWEDQGAPTAGFLDTNQDCQPG